MSKSKFKVARIAVSALTATATVMTFGGSALVALAAAPADYGLTEGDTISANDQAGDPDVYIVNDHGYKRLFTNPAIFGVYGHLSFAGVKQVSAATRDAFPTSGLFRNCETGDEKVYGLDVISEDVANLRWVNTSGAQAVADDPDFFKKVFCINSAEMALYGVGAEYSSVNDVPDYNRDGGTTPSADGFDPNGGTAGNIDNMTLGTPEDNEVLEGQDNVETYLAEIELSNDGPLLLQNVDVHVMENTAPDTKPWTYFNEVCVTLNGAELECMDADSSSDWNDQGSDEYKMRFTGVNGVLPSDDTSDLGVTFSANNVIDSADLVSAEYDVWVEDYRFLDESGLVQSDTFGTSDNFSIAGADVADVEARTASDDVEAMVVEVSDSSDTDGVVAYRFTLEETNNVDVDIQDLYVRVQTDTADVDQVVKRVRVMDGSDTLCDEAPTTGSTDEGALCEDIDISLNGDEKDEFTVELDLHDTDDQADYADGELVMVSIEATDFQATDANGNDEGDMGGLDAAADGEWHELRANGISVSLIEHDADITPGEGGVSSDKGTFTIKFAVTAFGDIAYVDAGCVEDDDQLSDDEGTSYTYSGSSTDVNCSMSSSGTDIVSGDFRVLEDETRDFTLVVVAEGEDTFESVAIEAINWGLTDGNLDEYHTFNLEQYETDEIFLDDQGV